MRPSEMFKSVEEMSHLLKFNETTCLEVWVDAVLTKHPSEQLRHLRIYFIDFA